jgi:L-histidine N-alpha-methyltransferase
MAANAGKAILDSASLYRDFRNLLTRPDSAILQGQVAVDPVGDFARSTIEGLAARPRWLEYRFLYDAKGSALFDLITEQPEYYLTRSEGGILEENADRIHEIAGPVTLVELGSGSAVKTGCLLRSWLNGGGTTRYVPVDVSMTALRNACRNISGSLPGVRAIGVNTDYYRALPLLREVSPVMVLFLGSSIGNFAPPEMDRFIDSLAAALTPEDFFLIGIDLLKERELLEAAYNDAAGVTADFTRNLFARMNRELSSGIDLSAVEHVAEFNPEAEQIEISCRFARKQVIRVEPLDTEFEVDEGEMIHIERCRKFRLREFLSYMGESGFTTEEVFTDRRKWFAVVLLRRSDAMG